ncbi:DUF4174 domain-containing protein [Sphingomonas crusticola]|uniref:DUF4174 domain-containing protein n=1 Tax=Sphingomonas crusticola TaxID=1697973 RepID=UPI001F084707|nr:DUF4174 domain-containing protein [Sphingomonas crusticola]
MNYLYLFAAVPLMAASPGNIASMRWERRILLVAAPNAQDARLAAQRRVIAGWRAEGEARDLSIVEIVADKVAGATDTGASLRGKYRLPTDAFAVVLIGKDGGEKLRRASPISATLLEQTIDAMPMRRHGER